MFIFAHIFAGALMGLVFWHLADDPRAVLFCIAGSILPDLMDKSLGLLFPSVLGGGRTIFHMLLIVLIVLLSMLLCFRSTSGRFLISGVASAILLHQVLDEMWLLPANWFYPFLGPFQGHMIPDYIGTYFWLEISNPSEWLFMIGAVLILAESFEGFTHFPHSTHSDHLVTGFHLLFASVLLVTGLYLIIAGFTRTITFMTPGYLSFPTGVAGILALSGAAVIGRKKLSIPDN